MTGAAVGEQELNDAVFSVPVKEDVVHQVMVAQQANSRQVVAHTKTRGEVRGGGRKPHRQKGTGRARAGSIRSPLWRGGGVVFGPRKDRNYTKQVNRKMKQSALRMVLSDKVANDHLVVVDEWAVAEGKTTNLKASLQKLPSADSKVLISLAKKNDDLVKAASNLMNTNYIAADSLNVVDLLKNDYVVLDKAAIELINERLAK